MFRVSRAATDTRFLPIRIGLLVVGATLGLAGMVSERGWLVWTGAAILLVGVVMRMVRRRSEENAE